MAIDWGTYSNGARIVPIVLVHGAPWVFVAEGVAITALSLSASDPLFWPSTTAPFTANDRAWISLRDGFSWAEQLQPTQPNMLDVGAVTVTLSDVGYEATALFSSDDTITATYLTAEVSATATTVNVVSTSAFASSGVFYLDREAIAYSGKTGTSFTGCTRGQYGSTATRHTYATAQGTGMGNPQARDAVGNPVGYPASVWFGRVFNNVLIDVELQFVGNIGVGAALADDGDEWVLNLDHAVKKLSQPIRAQPVLVSGYAHAGNLGVRTSTPPGRGAASPDLTNPAWLQFYSGSTVNYYVTLTGDANTTDRGGWHPTREAFVNALDQAGRTALGSDTFSASLLPSGTLRVVSLLASANGVNFCFPWDQGLNGVPSATSQVITSTRPMPEAWVPITIGATLYFNDSDYATIPSVPVLDAGAAATNTDAFYCLAFDRSGEVPLYAAIETLGSSGGVNYATINPLVSSSLTPPQGATEQTTQLFRGARIAGWVIEKPTNARLALLVRSDSWVAALRYAVCAVNDALADSTAEVFDWDDIEATVSLRASPAGASREYVIDLNESVLSVIVNEAALNGYALALKNGRITFVRVAEFAVTEPTDDTITSGDLQHDCVPRYELAADGITNTYELAFSGGSKATYVDQTSRARYGQGRTAIKARYPNGTYLTDTAAQLYLRVATVAVQSLGPHRYPYRMVTVVCALDKVGIQTGALLDLSLWRIPNQSGTRGLTNVIAQVMSRTPAFYGDQAGGTTLTLRLNPSAVAGYAPAMLVAASGISGAIVTADTSTAFGTSCFAIAGRDPTDGFVAGDKVRLIEIDNDSPAASTSHTVVSVTGSTLELNPAPNATFVALSAGQLNVMVIYDNWDVVVTAQQVGWCYLAESDGTLDGDLPRLYAA